MTEPSTSSPEISFTPIQTLDEFTDVVIDLKQFFGHTDEVGIVIILCVWCSVPLRRLRAPVLSITVSMSNLLIDLLKKAIDKPGWNVAFIITSCYFLLQMDCNV